MSLKLNKPQLSSFLYLVLEWWPYDLGKKNKLWVKTQKLSVTENLYFARIKDTLNWYKKWLLYTVQIQEQVTPKMITGNSFAPSFLETPHTFYNTDHKEWINNAYLIFINGLK